MKRIYKAALRAVIAAGMIFCFLGVSQPAVSQETVSISPTNTSIKSGGRIQYKATVLNTTDTSVQWGACSGTITQTGLFTAPVVSAKESICVYAISVADPNQTAATFAMVSPRPTSAVIAAPLAKGDVWTGPATDGPANLPRACVYTSLDGSPSPGKATLIASGGNVVNAVSAASCGDTILLQAGGTYTFTGTPVFPSKNCDAQHWITIRTNTPDSGLTPEHARINPSYAGVPSLPGRPAYHGPNQNVMAKLVLGLKPILIGDHYRLIGLEITRPADGKWYNSLLNPAGSHIIIDRSWVHGDPIAETTHLVQMNSGADHVAVINSYINDAHCTAVTGACLDAQAIADGGYATTVKAYNNFLEGSAETFEFGGSAATLITSDIEIRLNHMFKPLIWNPSDPSYFGHKFIVKNLFEMKEGDRALVEGNVLENTWGGFTQIGAAILLTPKNQSGANGANLCPQCYVANVTMRYNYVLHAAMTMQLGYGMSDNGGWPAGSYNYSIHDMLYDGMQYPTCYGCGSTTGQIVSGYSPTNPPPSVLHDVKFDHITTITNGFLQKGQTPMANAEDGFLVMGGPPAGSPQIYNMNYTNSIANTGNSGLVSTGGGSTNCVNGKKGVTAVIAACWVGASSFTSNAFVEDVATPNFLFPAGNTVVKSWSAVGFVNFGNGDGGDYHLQTSSPFYRAGSDGKDLGADVDAINAAVTFAR